MEQIEIVGLWEIVTDYANTFLQHLPTLGIALVILVAGWLAAKLTKKGVRKTAERFTQDPSLISLFGTISYIVAISIAVFAAAATVFPGLQAGDLIAVLGLSSVAIGFAFKDIFENFLAGVLILSRRPFRIGDFIEVQDVDGEVKDISFRNTVLTESSGEDIVMPNAILFKNPVTVRTANAARRTTFEAGIGYDEDIDTAREVIREAVEGCSEVHDDPAPQIYCWSHDSSAVTFNVRYWTGSENSAVSKGRDEVATAIKYALDDADIEIPYPYVSLDYPLEEKLEQVRLAS